MFPVTVTSANAGAAADKAASSKPNKCTELSQTQRIDSFRFGNSWSLEFRGSWACTRRQKWENNKKNLTLLEHNSRCSGFDVPFRAVTFRNGFPTDRFFSAPWVSFIEWHSWMPFTERHSFINMILIVKPTGFLLADETANKTELLAFYIEAKSETVFLDVERSPFWRWRGWDDVSSGMSMRVPLHLSELWGANVQMLLSIQLHPSLRRIALHRLDICLHIVYTVIFTTTLFSYLDRIRSKTSYHFVRYCFVYFPN